MSSSLISRLGSAAVGLALVAFLYFQFGSIGLYSICSIAFLILGYECGLMTIKSRIDILSLLILNLSWFTIFFFRPEPIILAGVILIEVCTWIWIQRLRNISAKEIYETHPHLYEFIFFSLIAPTFLLAHLNSNLHTEAILFLFFIVAAFDTLSYIWGKSLGGKFFKTKLFPQSSPSKTIEGALFAWISCLPLTLVLDTRLPNYSIFTEKHSLGFKLFFITVICIAALSGDLAESIIKRSSGTKDSGNLLPGHGGFFDRLDGLLFAGIISYLLLQF